MVSHTSFLLGIGRLRIFLVGILIVSALLSLGRADYTITVGGNDISVQIQGSFAQGIPNVSANNTAEIFASIPVFHLRLQGPNATLFSDYLNTAIKSKSASAEAVQALLVAESNGTRLNYNLTFRVRGIVQVIGAFDKVDLSWRSFKVTNDIGVGTIAVNRVFPTYLQSQIEILASQGSGSTQTEQLRWYVNNLRTTPSTIAGITANLRLFDFQSLDSPLQNWARTNDLSSSSVSLRSSTGFNVTLIERFTEGPEGTNFATDAIYNVETVIHAPLTTAVSSDHLSFEGAGAAKEYELMIAVMVAPLVLLISTLLVERKYSTVGRSNEKSVKRSRKPPSSKN